MTTAAIDYEFEPIPSRILNQVDNPRSIQLLMAISWCLRHGIHSPCVRLLASMTKCTRQWAHKLLKALEKANIIRITRRRISATRNDTNIYQIVGFNPRQPEFTEGLVQEKQRQAESLKAQVRRLGNRLAEQAKFFKDYINRGQQIRQGRQWQEKKLMEAAKMQALARVGAAPEWTEEERQALEKYWEAKYGRPAAGFENPAAGGEMV